MYGQTGIKMENKMDKSRHFYGKYKGIVVDNNDPQNRGRLRIQIPRVTGKQHDSNWALPCLPPGSYVIPNPGTGVWVEFEEGNPDKPIWSGYWLAEGETIYNNFLAGVKYNLEEQTLHIFSDVIIQLGDSNTFLKYNKTDNTITLEGGQILINSEDILIGTGADAPLIPGDTLKTWLNGHTHNYTWGDTAGSGTTDSPGTNAPEPSNYVKMKR